MRSTKPCEMTNHLKMCECCGNRMFAIKFACVRVTRELSCAAYAFHTMLPSHRFAFSDVFEAKLFHFAEEGLCVCIYVFRARASLIVCCIRPYRSIQQ